MNLRTTALFLLLAPALFAQDVFSPRQIESALEDELYALAEQKIWGALSMRRTAEEEAALTVLLVRALIGEKKFDDAVILTKESSALPRQDAFAYWRARALFEAGRFREVFQTLETSRKKLEGTLYAPAALRLEGRAAQASGDAKSAQKSFESFRKQFPGDENAAQNLLDLAAIYLDRSRSGDATKALQELLTRFPDDALAATARLTLARQLIATGGNDELREASGLLTALGADENAPYPLRSVAWVELAAIEQHVGNSAAAADALAQAERLTRETALRARQKAEQANLRMGENKTKEAFALFDAAVKEAPDTATAAEILVQKAEALLKINQYTEAENAFQTSLNIAADPALQARAQAGKGWCLWEQKRYEEAAVAFEAAGARYTDPDSCVTAFIKAGDAHLASGQHEKARQSYALVTDRYPDHPQAARALYQSGIAALSADLPDAARTAFAQVEEVFPGSDFAPQAALQIAELLKREQKWTPALEEYRRIAAQYTNSPVQTTAVQQQGLILYRTGQWADAREQFRTVSTNWPESPEAPQAFYMRGFCRYLQGDPDGAMEILKSFVEKYPDSAWAPEVLFWTGEHYYNHGDYTAAQAVFLDIATRFPKQDLSDDALFWAGSALFKQDSFLEAFTVFSRLAKEFPDSSLMLKTRFAQGETLTELGEFPRAILAYEEVIKAAPDDPLADRARGRLADSLFTLGTTEPGRYEEALAAYLALYNRPSATLALKLQALYKAARCEAKLGRKEQAFAHYMDVVYSGADPKEPLSPEAIAWFTRAAFDAAAWQEQQQQWREAVNIYGRIVQAGVPAKDEAQNRIDRIKREHASAF